MKRLALLVISCALCFNYALANTTERYNIKVNAVDSQNKTVDFDISDIDSISESNYDRANYPKNKIRVLVNLLPVAVSKVGDEAELQAKKARQEILDGQEYTLNKYPIQNEQIINVYYDAETKEIFLPKHHQNQHTAKLEEDINKVTKFINTKYNKFNTLELDIAGSGSSIFIDNDKVQNSDKFIDLLLEIGAKYQKINIDFMICNSGLFTHLYKIVQERNKDSKVVNINLYNGSIYLEHYYGSYDNKKLFDFVSNIHKTAPFVIDNKDITSEIKEIINKGQKNHRGKNKFRIIFNRLLLLDKATKENIIEKIPCGDNICPVFKEPILTKALHVF